MAMVMTRTLSRSSKGTIFTIPHSSAFHRSAMPRTRFVNKNSFKGTTPRRNFLKVCAAQLPAGVENPKEEPKLQTAFCGFTRTAEIWNSRACMIGLLGTFIVELLIQKGILQVIGVEVGKGLDLPL